MSATEFREIMRRKLDVVANGDGVESGGIASTMMSGAPRDYATYRDLCGYVRALGHMQTWMDEALAEMHGTTEPNDLEKT